MKKVKALIWAAVMVFAVAVTTVGKADGADTAAGSEFVKFRFAHWNIGHFSYYDGANGKDQTTISAEKADEMALRYKKVINEVSPDVMGVAEYEPVFALDGRLAKDVIFHNFKNQYIGTKYAYNCNSIFMNGMAALSEKEVKFTKMVQTRYYKVVEVKLKGRIVKIVETHTDWNQGENGAAYRALQIREILDAFAKDEYVILAADWNVDSKVAMEEYQPFIDAGYTMANGGYLGLLSTYPRSKSGGFIDNIMVKGFAVSNIGVSEESGNLSDHQLIYCDLIMN